MTTEIKERKEENPTLKRIGLIQIDGTMPNLALMKLSAFYKSKGFEVVFIDLADLERQLKEKTKQDFQNSTLKMEDYDRLEKTLKDERTEEIMEIIDDMKIDVDGERAWLDYKNLKSKILSSERVLSVEKLPTVKESNLSSEKDKVKSKTGDGKKGMRMKCQHL